VTAHRISYVLCALKSDEKRFNDEEPHPHGDAAVPLAGEVIIVPENLIVNYGREVRTTNRSEI